MADSICVPVAIITPRTTSSVPIINPPDSISPRRRELRKTAAISSTYCLSDTVVMLTRLLAH